jgi:hypothetical protein
MEKAPEEDAQTGQKNTNTGRRSPVQYVMIHQVSP